MCLRKTRGEVKKGYRKHTTDDILKRKLEGKGAVLIEGPKDLLKDLNPFGFLLETLCVRNLRVFVESLNGNFYYYRDKEGL